MSITEQDTERVSAPPREREVAREERARILEAAALEIEVRGHAKGQLMADTGAVCANGALLCAQGALLNPGPANANKGIWDSPAGLATLALHGSPETSWEFVGFNNARERTAAEVTFLLRWRAQELRDGR